jgi:hypothetical protein
MHGMSPQQLMHIMFAGLGASTAYGAFGFWLVYWLEGKARAQQFLTAYVSSFNVLLSLGLIVGSAWLVFRSQKLIPDTIEKAFDGDTGLWLTRYSFYKGRFNDHVRSITIAAVYATIGYAIFAACNFPLTGRAEVLMLVASCAQYGVGAYVGRKLCYAGMMLYSLLEAHVSRNLFRGRELDGINAYVHIASTLTILFVYANVRGYYYGPFTYDTWLGKNPRAFLLFPAVVATPVLLIFNFYSRAVLRKLYNESIDVEIRSLQTALQSESLTEFEKRSYAIEVDKMTRDELRYSLQLTLSDLPIGITVALMILQPLFEK